jgi:hypothetical protein
MVGITQNEVVTPVPGILASADVMKKLNENFNDFAPICFSFVSDAEFTKKIRKLYFPYDTIDSRSFDGINKISGDGVIGFGAQNFVRLMSNFTPVYNYKFSFVGRYSFFLYPSNKPYGVCHGDDLIYMMPYPGLGPMIKVKDPENIMVERWTRIITQFALTG